MVQRKPSLILFATFCLVAGVLVGLGRLAVLAKDLKNNLSEKSLSAVTELQSGQQALSQKDFTGAQTHFGNALQNFSEAQNTLARSNPILRFTINIIPQTKTAGNALTAGVLAAKAGMQLTSVYQEALALKLSPQGIEAPTNDSNALANINTNFSQATQNINNAISNLKKVNPALVPASKRGQFESISGKLDQLQSAVNSGQKLFAAFAGIVIPKSTVLVLFENNNELRPGGGFIGTYGRFELENGKIQSQTISSIYDLDGQLNQRISPPTPMLAVNNRWYLRDSNWFADFPSSAQKVSQFYEMEAGETPSAIVALTPTFVSNLLTVTGSISVPTFHITLNSDNFIEQTQAISTISETSPLNKPKQILADFFPLFLQKLQTLSQDQNKQLLAVLLQNLQAKQLVFFSPNSQAEAAFANFNWAGQVNNTDRDYLQIVSSNLGGTKTDLYLQKKADLQTTITNEGEVLDSLTLTVANTLPNIHDSQNVSFLRFLVPPGSEILTADGFTKKNFTGDADPTFKQDPDIKVWDMNLTTDQATQMLVGQESGKTFFGNWLTVAGGETKTVKIVYKLPFKLNSIDRFGLLWQKQLGSLNDAYNYSVNFAGKELQYKSYVPNREDGNNISVFGQLDKDYFFGLVLKSN